MPTGISKETNLASGVPLLAVYVVLAVGSFGCAVGLMYITEQILGPAAGLLFVVFIIGALVAPWPAAVWLTEPRSREPALKPSPQHR